MVTYIFIIENNYVPESGVEMGLKFSDSAPPELAIATPLAVH